MTIANLSIILAVVITILAGIIMWDIMVKRTQKNERKRCEIPKTCKKAVDCGSSNDICFSNMCIPRVFCQAEIPDGGCDSGQRCLVKGDLGYCVPDVPLPGDDRGERVATLASNPHEG